MLLESERGVIADPLVKSCDGASELSYSSGRADRERGSDKLSGTEPLLSVCIVSRSSVELLVIMTACFLSYLLMRDVTSLVL